MAQTKQPAKPKTKAVEGEVIHKKPTTKGKKTRTTKTTRTVRVYTYKWDVVSAQAEYVSNHTLSHRDIAEKYGVTPKAVSEYASKHKWAELRQKVSENAIAEFQSKREQEIEATIEKHVNLYKNMQSFGNNTLTRLMKQAGKEGIPDLKGAGTAAYILKTGIEGERTALGLPTLIAAGQGKNPGEDQRALSLTEMMEMVETQEVTEDVSD